VNVSKSFVLRYEFIDLILWAYDRAVNTYEAVVQNSDAVMLASDLYTAELVSVNKSNASNAVVKRIVLDYMQSSLFSVIRKPITILSEFHSLWTNSADP
jgi:hypothetical protein